MPYTHWRRLLGPVRDALGKVPGVVGVGLGTSTTGQLAWRVYVEADGHEIPPAELMGLPTCVMVGRPTVLSASNPVTYTAGMTVETNQHEGEGTLGGFAQDKNGKPVLVSDSHVLFPGFEVIPNLKAYVPDYSSCCGGGDPVATPQYDTSQSAAPDGEGGLVGGYAPGTWTGGFNWVAYKEQGPGGNLFDSHGSEVDCAVAKLDPGVQFLNAWSITVDKTTTTTIPIKGAIAADPNNAAPGVVKGPPFGTLPSDGQYVRFYSAITGKLQYGTVLSTPRPNALKDPHDPDNLIYPFGIVGDDDKTEGIKRTIRQMLILPRPAPVSGKSLQELYGGVTVDDLDIVRGQSGSWVINSDNLVVGMIVRKVLLTKVMTIDPTIIELQKAPALAVVTPIQAVLQHLNITIPSAPNGWSGTGTAAGYSPLQGPVSTTYVPRPGRSLRRDLRQTAGGQLLLDLIAKHRREIRWMLTTVRPVGAAWRDVEGPAPVQPLPTLPRRSNPPHPAHHQRNHPPAHGGHHVAAVDALRQHRTSTGPDHLSRWFDEGDHQGRHNERRRGARRNHGRAAMTDDGGTLQALLGELTKLLAPLTGLDTPAPAFLTSLGLPVTANQAQQLAPNLVTVASATGSVVDLGLQVEAAVSSGQIDQILTKLAAAGSQITNVQHAFAAIANAAAGLNLPGAGPIVADLARRI